MDRVDTVDVRFADFVARLVPKMLNVLKLNLHIPILRFLSSSFLNRRIINRLISNGAHSEALQSLRSAGYLYFTLMVSGLFAFYCTPVAVVLEYGSGNYSWTMCSLIILILCVLALLFRETSYRFSRDRIGRSIARISSALELWDDERGGEPNDPPDILEILDLEQTRINQRLLRTLSWRLTRDIVRIASIAGYDPERSEWKDAGRTLTWVSMGLNDRRRRAVGWECLAQVATFAGRPDMGAPSVFYLRQCATCPVLHVAIGCDGSPMLPKLHSLLAS